MDTNRIAVIRELRQRTAATILVCRQALEANGWDVDMACLAMAKAKHEASDGKAHEKYGVVAMCGSEYSRVGAMVELTCESGYAAKHHDFVKLANVIAIHVAWSNPRYIGRDDVDHRDVENAKEAFHDAAKDELLAKHAMQCAENGTSSMPVFSYGWADKFVEQQMDSKFYPRVCLLDQPEIKETRGECTIGELVRRMENRFGEKITVRRFVRFDVSE